MKKLISIILSVILILAMVACGPTPVEEPPIEEPPVQEPEKYATFVLPSENTKRSDKLALSLINLANNSTKFETKRAMEKLNLDVLMQDNYTHDGSPNTHTSGFSVGHGYAKFIDKEGWIEIIVIAIRPTYKTEWLANFNSSTDEEKGYGNFGFAAEDILARIKDILDEYKDASIVLTGYSRGAGVANVLAKFLVDQGKNNLYAYTFASPQGVKSEIASGYHRKGIFNYVNPADIVTMVVPENWGYTRVGIDVELPNEAAGLGATTVMTLLMQQIPTEEAYYTEKVSDLLSSYMEDIDSESTWYEAMLELAKSLAGTSGSTSTLSSPVKLADSGLSLETIFSQHYPTVYRTLIKALIDAKDDGFEYSE